MIREGAVVEICPFKKDARLDHSSHAVFDGSRARVEGFTHSEPSGLR